MATEQCRNCERIIGNLETRYLFNGHVVCADCDLKLRAKQKPIPQSRTPQPHIRKPTPPTAAFKSVTPARSKHKNTKSRTLWLALLVWTVVMFALMLTTTNYYEEQASSRSRSEELDVRFTGIDPERSAGGCWLCSFSLVWLLVATPLFISAVATSRNK